MKIAESALSKDEEKPEWKMVALREMETSNSLKFDNYCHAKEVLMEMKRHIVEATSNIYWGSGLPPDLIKSMLSDYWPGENQFGKVLMKLRDCYKESVEESKCKASSPLANARLYSQVFLAKHFFLCAG